MEPGIDRFVRSRDKRTVGLVTNHTGRLSSGELTVDGLIDKGFTLKTLFSPEHGLFGVDQDGIATGDRHYRGIRTCSLYGERRKPLPEQLAGLEVLLFDMQDIGFRYYTYLYTLAYVMEAAGDAGLPLIVADRPAPVGRRVEGRPVEKAFESFIGAYGLPVRTGMTIGEYALYLKKYYYPGVELTVLPVEDYHGGWWEPEWEWVNPSPNIPSLNTALVYGGTCLFEGTHISEGRGTTRPFETIGAPGVDGRILAGELNGLNLAGVRFSRMDFKPVAGKHQGEVCGGVRIHVTDPNVYNSLQTGIALLTAFFSLFPQAVSLRASEEEGGLRFLDKLTGSREFGDKLPGCSDYRELYSLISGGESDFEDRRRGSLLYG